MDETEAFGATKEENSDYEGDENGLSVTAVANKSLDLSKSLTDHCSKLADMVMDDFLLPEVADLPDVEVVHKVHIFPKSDSFKASPDSESVQAQRKEVVNEILETEKSYCDGLWLLLNHFINSIRKSRIVSEDVLQMMFSSSLEEIFKCHCDLLQSLEIRVLNWSLNSCLGDIFSDVFKSHNCPIFQQYQLYMRGFSTSLLKISKISNTNPDFYNFLRNLEEDKKCNRLSIASYLLTPVQRIPRYVLLLKQLLKHTNPEHVDCALISSSLKELAMFLTRLNSSIEHSISLVSMGSFKPKKKFGISLSFRLNIQPPKKLQRQLSSKQNSIPQPGNCDPKTSTPIKKGHASKAPSFEESSQPQARDEHKEASIKPGVKSDCEETLDVNSLILEQTNKESKMATSDALTLTLPHGLLPQGNVNRSDFKSHLLAMRKKADFKGKKGPIAASHDISVPTQQHQVKALKRTMSGGSSTSKEKWLKKFRPSQESELALDELDTTTGSFKKRTLKDSLKNMLRFKSFSTMPRSQNSTSSLSSTFLDKPTSNS